MLALDGVLTLFGLSSHSVIHRVDTHTKRGKQNADQTRRHMLIYTHACKYWKCIYWIKHCCLVGSEELLLCVDLDPGINSPSKIDIYSKIK